MYKFFVIAFSIIAAAVLGYFFAMTGKPIVNDTAHTRQSQSTCAKSTGHADMVWVEGGVFTRGATGFYPEEAPPGEIEVDGFWIDRFEVTNTRFSEFVEATGYVSIAEREPNPEDFPGIEAELLEPGSIIFIRPSESAGRLTQWWQFVPGANWREPTGPGSSIKGREHYPVVHVAYEDALAYANWLGHTLPTETQWEYAARGGLDKAVFAWGNEFLLEGKYQANTWQGIFPVMNSNEDGFSGTAPVGCFPANGYGLHDMIGNVWEWVDAWYYPGHGQQVSANGNSHAQGHDPRQPGVPVKVIKGGSYLCAENYCRRYRPAARHAQETMLGATHIGFRTVKNRG